MKVQTSLFLMANLGSEVTRIFSYQDRRDSNMFNLAMEKTKSIFAELKNIPETKDNGEIDILRDIINDISQNSKKYDVPLEQLQSYFYPFAMKVISA